MTLKYVELKPEDAEGIRLERLLRIVGFTEGDKKFNLFCLKHGHPLSKNDYFHRRCNEKDSGVGCKYLINYILPKEKYKVLSGEEKDLIKSNQKLYKNNK